MLQSFRFLCSTCTSKHFIIHYLQVPSQNSKLGFSFIILICLPVWNSLGPAGHILVKLYIGLFH